MPTTKNESRPVIPEKPASLAVRPLWVAVFLFALVIAAYSSVIARGGFVWDDSVLITQNGLIKSPAGLHYYWFTTEAVDYLPITWSSLWLEWRLWGGSPTGFHFTNILLHALSAFLLYIVLKRMKVPGAILAACIFAVHPVAVASVAWISERKNTLSLVFYLLAILKYLDFEDDRKWKHYKWIVVFFVLALLSKSSVIVAPLVMLGCAWWRRGKITWRNILDVTPLLVLSALSAAATIYFQDIRAIGIVSTRPEGFLSRLAVAGMAPWFYLYKIILPVNLTVYPRWEVAGNKISDFLPGAALAATLITLVVFRKTSWGRASLFAAGYFLVCLFPVLGLFEMSFAATSLVADHLQYLAMIGPIALIAGAAWNWGSKLTAKTHRYLLIAVSACIILLLAALSFKQGLTYENSSTFWNDVLLKNPSCPEAYYNAGLNYDDKHDFKTATEYYQKALALRPRFSDALNNLAVIYLHDGQEEKALHYFQLAIDCKTDNMESRYNLALMLTRQGRYDQAVEQYKYILRMIPNWSLPLENLTFIYSSAPDPSVRNGKMAIELAVRLNKLTNYNNPVSLDYLAMAYAENGDFARAVETAKRASDKATFAGMLNLLPGINERLNLYRRSLPYRFPPPVGTTSMPSSSAPSR